MQYIPTSIAAGTTLRWSVVVDQYPASEGWSATLYLRGESAIDVPALWVDGCHLFEVDATTTASWGAGSYRAVLRMELNGTVVDVPQGNVRVTQNVATIEAGHDGRSHAEKVLEAVEAVIEGRASLDQERYRIANRELQRTPLSELLRLRTRYREEVRTAKAKASGRSGYGRQIRVTFK